MSEHPRCDHCDGRLRPGQHDIHLEDFEVGRELGRFRYACRDALAKYSSCGAEKVATILHPERCGEPPEFEHCDLA